MGLGWVIEGMPYHRYLDAATKNSNNVAEYLAFIEVLRWAEVQPEPAELQISGDSQLVIMQMIGEYAVKSANLIPLYREAKERITNLRNAGWRLTVDWVRRERNADADAGSKLALKEHGIQPARRDPDSGWTTRLGDIAEHLGISAVVLGKLMAATGLRDKQQPTPVAVNLGIAQQRFNGYGISIDWHEQGVIDTIREKQADALAVAVNSQAKKDVRAAAKWAAEHAANSHMLAEQARISAYRPEVERIVETENCSLLDAVEWAVEDVSDRAAVYAHRRGWWKQRAISGLRASVPEEKAQIEAITMTTEREHALLERRAASA